MAAGLTARQREILSFLAGFLQEHSFPASVKDIQEEFNFASPASVTDHLKAISKKGYIKTQPRLSRGLEILEKGWEELGINNSLTPADNSVSLPLVGEVAAGAMSLAVEDIEARYQVDKDLFEGTPTFMLKVKGESMIEIGIYDGDFVVVERTPVARDGQVIVAMVDDEATVKTYYREGKFIRLQPENESMEPIMIDSSREQVSIIGKIVGLVRKM